mmetsp:Transcript_21903/g.40216  ORF Transcript_21903/g.40216 Transcript_21903/m.40216 type:complete len:80 (-) Transcript_21903:1277-1516(-)
MQFGLGSIHTFPPQEPRQFASDSLHHSSSPQLAKFQEQQKSDGLDVVAEVLVDVDVVAGGFVVVEVVVVVVVVSVEGGG